VSYYGLFEAMPLLKATAVATVVLEGLLAILLISGVRLHGVTHAATAVLLLAFSGLVAYAWVFEGLEECGCFGQVVATGPLATLVKNAILLALTAVVWRLSRARSGVPARRVASVTGVAAACVVILGVCIVAGDNDGFLEAAPDQAAGRFAQFFIETDTGTLQLGEGRYLVALLSANCDHCLEAVEPLNEVAVDPEAPPVVALMLGHPEEIEEFRAISGALFPMRRVGDLEFMSLLEKQPPRFFVVQDGRSLADEETLHVTAVGLRALLASPGENRNAS
jgi:hypothetical protein